MTEPSVRQPGPGVDFRREAEEAARAAGVSVDEWARGIFGERSRQPDPAPAAPVPVADEPIGRIMGSLDRLGERIRALSAQSIPEKSAPAAAPPPAPAAAAAVSDSPEPRMPPAEAPVAATAATASDPVRAEAAPAGEPALRPRRSIDLQSAIEQIARKRDALDRAAARAEVEAEAARIAAERPAADTGQFDQLRTEIAAVREAVEAGSPGRRLAALEESYDDIVARLDQLRGAIDNPRTIADLVQRLAEIRRLLAQAPTESHLAAVAERIDRLEERIARPGDGGDIAELGDQVATLAVAVSGLDPAALLGAIDTRLDQVARQVGALEKRLGGPDGVVRLQDSVERQAAVLSMLAQRSEQIPRVAHEMERQSAAVEALSRRVETLPQLMTDVAELRGTLDAEATRTRQAVEDILGRMDDLAAAADHDGSVERLAALVDARLGDIAGRVAGLSAAAGPDVLALVEARMDALGERLERRMEALSGPPVAPEFPAELADALQRIEQQLAAGADGARLEAIEARIADLAETVGTGGAADLGALEASVSGMRADLAALSIPSVAALEAEVAALTRAVESFGGPDVPAQHVERLEVRIAEIGRRIGEAPADAARLESALSRFETTIADLASLQKDLRGGADRDRALLIAIGEAVERIAGRDLERDEPAAVPAPVAAMPVEEAVVEDAPVAETPVAETAVAETAPAEAAAAAAADTPRSQRFMDPADEVAWSEISRTLTASVGLPGKAGPVAGKDKRIEPRLDSVEPVDDRPLEPGSGKPDTLKAAAAPAADRDGARPEMSKADFIAAARRAAQVASAPQPAARPAAARKAKPDTRQPSDPVQQGGGGTGRGVLRSHKRALVAAAAAVVITVAAAQSVLPMIRTALGPDDGVADTTRSIPAADLAALDAAPDESVDVVDLPDAPATPPAAVVDDTATGSTPLGPPAAFGTGATTPQADRFARDAAPPADGERETAALAAPVPAAGTPALAPAEAAPSPSPTMGLPPETVGPLVLREAASGGDPAAQFEVAVRLTEARGAEQDLAEAARWYTMAAEAGLPLAQYRLGSLYEKGQGVARDPARAVDWYTRAAEAGNAKAMHNLAVLTASGYGPQPDYETAARWFEKAAAFGVRDSQYNLAILYAKGLGVPRDLAASYKWFAVAAAGGDADAAKKRDDVAQVLDQDALARARLAVETWSPSEPDAAANEPPAGEPSWYVTPERTAASLAGSGDPVADVQAMLTRLGYDAGPADGKMGERTRLAVEAFQRSSGLPVTGDVDESLLKALAERQT